MARQQAAARTAVGAQISGYGPETVSEFIKSALELGGESRTLAEALQKKLDAGQTITDEELGRLALAVEAEQAASGETAGVRETTPHQSAAQTASPRGEAQGEAIAQSPASTAPFTQSGQAEARADEGIGPYAGNENAASGTETAQGSTDSHGAARLGMTESEANGSAGNSQTSGNLNQEGTNNGAGDVSDRSGGRDAGKRAGGQTGELGSRAEAARAAAEQSAKAARRQHQAQDLRLTRTSPQSLGIQKGSTLPGVTVLPESAWDGEMRSEAEKVMRETGKQVVYVLGTIEVVGADGKSHKVRGVNTTYGQIVIQADHLRLSVTQIGDHELFHDVLRNDPGLAAEIRQRITNEYSAEEFDSVLQRYLTNYAGVYDVTDDMDAAAFEDATDRIAAEIYCDAYAGINAFGTNAGRWQAEAVTAAEERGAMGRGAEYAAATERTNGPGEDVYKLADAHVPTYEELIKKPDIQITDIRRNRQGTFKQERVAFLNSDAVRKMYTEPTVNRDTGESIFIIPASFTHIFSNLGWEQIELAEHLPEIIESAVLTHAESSRKAPVDRTTGVYTFFGAAMTDEGVQPVKLTVKEYNLDGQAIPNNVADYFEEFAGPDTYANIYDGKVLVLEGIEKEGPSSSAATDTVNKTVVYHPSEPSNISVADLLDLVKGDARKYIPEPSGDLYSMEDMEQPERLPVYGELPGRELPPSEPEGVWESARERAAGAEGQRYGQEREAHKAQEKAKRKAKSDENSAAWLRREIERRSGKDAQREIFEAQGAKGLADYVRETTRLQQKLDRLEGKTPQAAARKAEAQTPKAKPNIARQELRGGIMADFSIPAGERERTGRIIDRAAELLLQGGLTEENRRKFFDILYETGVMHVAADERPHQRQRHPGEQAIDRKSADRAACAFCVAGNHFLPGLNLPSGFACAAMRSSALSTCV